MSIWLHKTTKRILRNVTEDQLPGSIDDYLENPDLSQVMGNPKKYWIINGVNVTLAISSQQVIIDSNILSQKRDDMSNEIDNLETYSRAFALVMLDEVNLISNKINEILDAIENSTSLSDLQTTVQSIQNRPIRTATQLKTAVRNKLDT